MATVWGRKGNEVLKGITGAATDIAGLMDQYNQQQEFKRIQGAAPEEFGAVESTQTADSDYYGSDGTGVGPTTGLMTKKTTGYKMLGQDFDKMPTKAEKQAARMSAQAQYLYGTGDPKNIQLAAQLENHSAGLMKSAYEMTALKQAQDDDSALRSTLGKYAKMSDDEVFTNYNKNQGAFGDGFSVNTQSTPQGTILTYTDPSGKVVGQKPATPELMQQMRTQLAQAELQFATPGRFDKGVEQALTREKFAFDKTKHADDVSHKGKTLEETIRFHDLQGKKMDAQIRAMSQPKAQGAGKAQPLGITDEGLLIVADGNGGYTTKPIMVNGKPATPSQINMFKKLNGVQSGDSQLDPMVEVERDTPTGKVKMKVPMSIGDPTGFRELDLTRRAKVGGGALGSYTGEKKEPRAKAASPQAPITRLPEQTEFFRNPVTNEMIPAEEYYRKFGELPGQSFFGGLMNRFTYGQ